jgi:YHS domain-containing protein
MCVDARTANWETQHAGTRYVFCAERCLERFERAPGDYLDEAPTGPE